MKIKTTLNAIAIAIPGLVAMPVGASWNLGGGASGFPPWVYSSSANGSMGYTEGLYTEGVSADIYHESSGDEWGGGSYLSEGTAMNVTVYAENHTWDEATYSYGESSVSNVNGPGYAEGTVT